MPPVLCEVDAVLGEAPALEGQSSVPSTQHEAPAIEAPAIEDLPFLELLSYFGLNDQRTFGVDDPDI